MPNLKYLAIKNMQSLLPLSAIQAASNLEELRCGHLVYVDGPLHKYFPRLKRYIGRVTKDLWESAASYGKQLEVFPIVEKQDPSQRRLPVTPLSDESITQYAKLCPTLTSVSSTNDTDQSLQTVWKTFQIKELRLNTPSLSESGLNLLNMYNLTSLYVYAVDLSIYIISH
jgi:hypothetical protein